MYRRERFLASKPLAREVFFVSDAATNWRTCAPRTSTCPVGLELRIQVPQHSLALLAALDSCGPFSAKTNFVEPVPRGERWHEQRERRHCQRPRLVPQKRPHDAEYISRQFAAASVCPMNSSMSRPQPGEKFIYSSRAPHFRERMPDAGDGVRIAARNRDFSQPRRQPRGTLVGFWPHLPVARFKRRHIGFKPMEIFRYAPARQPGENVIGAEK